MYFFEFLHNILDGTCTRVNLEQTSAKSLNIVNRKLLV
jgi:hypothetical protein